jgi:hypothetical protein
MRPACFIQTKVIYFLYLCSVKFNHLKMKKYIFPAVAVLVSVLLLVSCSQNEREDLPGILINGVRWAPANIAAPGEFAASATDPGMLYQWGRRTGWSSAGDDLPPVSSPAGTAWNSTPATGDQWEAAADPCPEGWRLPTYEDFKKLLDTEKVSYLGSADDPDGIGVPPWGGSRAVAEDGTVLSHAEGIDQLDRDGLKRRAGDDFSGAEGIIFTDRLSGEKLLFPAAGKRSYDAGGLRNPGTDGFYWFLWDGGNMPDGFDIETVGCFFWFFVETHETPPRLSALPVRAEGFSVRCVLKR